MASPDYAALKLKLAEPAYAGLSASAAADALNAETVAAEAPTSGLAVGQLWARRGVLGKARERANRNTAAVTAPEIAARTLAWDALSMIEHDGFSGLDPSVPAQRTALLAFLDSLVTGSLMTAADRTATIALIARPVPLAATLGFEGRISDIDVNIARALP